MCSRRWGPAGTSGCDSAVTRATALAACAGSRSGPLITRRRLPRPRSPGPRSRNSRPIVKQCYTCEAPCPSDQEERCKKPRFRNTFSRLKRAALRSSKTSSPQNGPIHFGKPFGRSSKNGFTHSNPTKPKKTAPSTEPPGCCVSTRSSGTFPSTQP